MAESNYGQWQRMAGAPKDGSRILVLIRATEQGPNEVDVVRWTRAGRSSENCWLSTDSDSDCIIQYADAELAFWMPLPTPLPKLRLPFAASGLPEPPEEEAGGSGI